MAVCACACVSTSRAWARVVAHVRDVLYSTSALAPTTSCGSPLHGGIGLSVDTQASNACVCALARMLTPACAHVCVCPRVLRAARVRGCLGYGHVFVLARTVIPARTCTCVCPCVLRAACLHGCLVYGQGCVRVCVCVCVLARVLSLLSLIHI
eukprot:10405422-Alexandrium_andersonii.AAC.1